MAEDDKAAAGGSDGDACVGSAAEQGVPRTTLPEPPLPDDAKEFVDDIEKSEGKIFGVPLERAYALGFVKGGTTTSRHDNWMAASEADAKKRRAEADAERKIAQEHGIHQGNPGDLASLYSNQFTDHPEVMKAYVPLEYMARRGREVDYLGVGDIIMAQDPAFDDELTLMIFCPKCRDRGLPAGHCIIHLRQSNRSWHLDTRKAGELFVWEGQPMRSAGTVMDGEAFTCARCAWRARIDNNRVWTL
jgi:hypothetical protein